MNMIGTGKVNHESGTNKYLRVREKAAVQQILYVIRHNTTARFWLQTGKDIFIVN